MTRRRRDHGASEAGSRRSVDHGEARHPDRTRPSSRSADETRSRGGEEHGMTVTMRAVVVEHPGGLETLEIREAPVSTPAKGEVFIRALDAEAPRGETEAPRPPQRHPHRTLDRRRAGRPVRREVRRAAGSCRQGRPGLLCSSAHGADRRQPRRHADLGLRRLP